MLSKKDVEELERIGLRLEELANEAEGNYEERSERWKDSPKGERWLAFLDSIREAATALEIADWPE